MTESQLISSKKTGNVGEMMWWGWWFCGFVVLSASSTKGYINGDISQFIRVHAIAFLGFCKAIFVGHERNCILVHVHKLALVSQRMPWVAI